MAIFSLNPKEIGNDLAQELMIVMPVYNEAENIKPVLEEWEVAVSKLTSSYAFLIINDGSVDETQELLTQSEAVAPQHYVVVQKPNSGHGNSCRVGYDIAAASQCQWVLQIDSDGQCDPEFLDKFWSDKEEYDCIFGVRKSRDDGRARILTSQICRWGSSLICRADLRDPNVPYRLLRRSVLAKALSCIPAGFNIHNVALTFTLSKTPGIRWKFVDIHFRDRQGGSNSINLLSVMQWGLDMLLELWKLGKKLPKR